MNIYIMLEWVGKMRTYQLLLYVKFWLQKISQRAMLNILDEII